MKINRFLSIVFVFVSSIFADTIYLRDGQEVKDAVVTEIGDGNVKYKIGQREVVYTAKKSDIMMILYNDGGKDIFNAEAEKTEKPVATNKITESKKDGVRFGIRGGLARAGISGTDDFIGIDSYEAGFGAGLGAFVSIPISSFYFVPELFVQYRKLGELRFKTITSFQNIKNIIWFNREINDITREINDITYEGITDITCKGISIDIPLMFRFLLGNGEKFYLEAGPQISIRISDNQYNSDDDYQIHWNSYYNIETSSSSSISIKRSSDGVEYGLTLGVGYKITDNWGIDLRGYYGLVNYQENIERGSGFDIRYNGVSYVLIGNDNYEVYQVDGHIYYVQIGVSYTF